MKEFREESRKERLIRELGVFELRGVARQLGVPSPTTKKREELISLILEASNNGSYIEENIPKRGRPFKKLNILDSLSSKITPDKTERIDFESVIRFAQDVTPVFDKIDEKTYTFEGIIRKFENDSILYDFATSEQVVIENDIDGYSLLESGDKVKLECKKLVGQNLYMATKLLEINEQEASIYEPVKFEQGSEIIDNRTIPYDKGLIRVGRRNVYMLEEDIYENDKLKNLLSYCQKHNFHLIVIGANTVYENQIIFKEVGIKENFSTAYGYGANESFNKIIDGIIYANNLISRGEEVLVFVPDIVEIIRILDANFTIEPGMEHSSKSMVIATKLLSIARSYSSGNSGTLLMCYNKIDSDNKFLQNDILKISKKV